MPSKTGTQTLAFVQTRALVLDTFREAMARKIIWGFFGCSTALIVFFLLIVKIDIVEGTLATRSVLGRTSQTMEVDKMVRVAHAGIAALLYTFGGLLAVLASAGLIPTIFEPGRIELLLSKPVKRYHILLGRYLGNLLVIAANVFYPVIVIWIIFGLKTGVWTPGFLYSSLLTVFIFGVYLTVILLVGVQWESAVVATMVTFGMVIIGLIVANKNTIERLLSSEWSRDAVRGLYYVLPKVVDIANMMMTVVKGEPIESWMPVWSSALFGAACLAAGLYIFEKKNY
jgi:ABC-type transport system involved in multi-copper enzyme maturation permease subunit